MKLLLVYCSVTTDSLTIREYIKIVFIPNLFLQYFCLIL